MRNLLIVEYKIFNWETEPLNCDLWDLVPWPGIEPYPPVLGAWSLSHWTTMKFQVFMLFSLVAAQTYISNNSA